MNRVEMLLQLQETIEWDMVIIGGGATGFGTAVDAASRGYKTLLVERFDFGKGTSSRSTKLVHGGVRYLAQGNIKLVMEALRERAYLLHNAPGITTTMAFIVPVYTWFDKWFYGIGLKLYDVLSGKLSIGKTKLLNKQQTLQHLDGIDAKNLKGGILYYDGQFDDARLVIALAKTAVKNGATVVNYCSATSIQKENNKVTGITVTDELSKQSYTVKAKVVINATGVFTDGIIQMDEPEKEKLVSPSQGIHLVVNNAFFPSANALMIPKTEDGRVLFAVPWHNKVVLGTTDTPVNNVSAEPMPLEEEIGFVLHHANKYLAQTITRKDVLSVFAGLRPLVKKKGVGKTAALNRDHTIIVSKSGLISVTGGKWTTYRKMAEDVIDNAVFVAKLDKRKCITKDLVLEVDKGTGLPNGVTLSNEAITFFVHEEMAMTVEDILARRTRLLLLDAKAAIAAAETVAQQMAHIMNKDQGWIQHEVEAFKIIAKQYVLE